MMSPFELRRLTIVCLLAAVLTGCQPTALPVHPTSTAAGSAAILATPAASTPIGSPQVQTAIPLDWKPTLIAQGDGILWIVGREDHIVARLDPRTSQLLEPVTALPEPIYDILVGEGGVWVTGDTLVTRLDPVAGKVVGTLRADRFGDGTPFRLALGDGLVWLLNLENAPSHVHRIDPRTNQFTGEPATVGIEAVGLTFGAGSIWTADHDDGTVSRVDPQTNKVMATIKIIFEPHYIYFNPDDGLLWVANYHGNSLSRIDPNLNQLVGEPLPVPFAPEWMTSGDGKIWVFPSPYAENNVPQTFEGFVEFDTAHSDEASIISVDGLPMDGVVSAGSLWVTTQKPNQILRIGIE